MCIRDSSSAMSGGSGGSTGAFAAGQLVPYAANAWTAQVSVVYTLVADARLLIALIANCSLLVGCGGPSSQAATPAGVKARGTKSARPGAGRSIRASAFGRGVSTRVSNLLSATHGETTDNLQERRRNNSRALA
eukprot:3953663-Pyramimonas_sp.AAC.1